MGAGGDGVCECEGETEPKKKPGASPQRLNYNEFNLHPHRIQMTNDLSSRSYFHSCERKEEGEKICFIRDTDI